MKLRDFHPVAIRTAITNILISPLKGKNILDEGLEISAFGFGCFFFSFLGGRSGEMWRTHTQPSNTLGINWNDECEPGLSTTTATATLMLLFAGWEQIRPPPRQPAASQIWWKVSQKRAWQWERRLLPAVEARRCVVTEKSQNKTTKDHKYLDTGILSGQLDFLFML